MIRWLLLVILAVIAMTSTGCVAPRALGLYSLVTDTAPVRSGDTLENTTVRPVLLFGEGPTAYVLINSSRPADETLAFYRDHLKRRGWVEEERSKGLAAPNSDKTAEWYYFRRVRSIGAGKNVWTYSTEELQMVLDISEIPQRPKGNMKVEFSIDGEYAWDIPSKLPAWVTIALFGEAAQAFGWINLPL